MAVKPTHLSILSTFIPTPSPWSQVYKENQSQASLLSRTQASFRHIFQPLGPQILQLFLDAGTPWSLWIHGCLKPRRLGNLLRATLKPRRFFRTTISVKANGFGQVEGRHVSWQFDVLNNGFIDGVQNVENPPVDRYRVLQKVFVSHVFWNVFGILRSQSFLLDFWRIKKSSSSWGQAAEISIGWLNTSYVVASTSSLRLLQDLPNFCRSVNSES